MPKLCLIVAATVVFFVSNAQSEVVITVRADKESYVAREPITLVVSFRNTSSETLGIIGSVNLGQNMLHMSYRIREPDGTIVRRYHRWLTPIPIIDPSYTGEPLAPGDHIAVNLYPARSGSVKGDPPRYGFTFDKPGTYGLSVLYTPPAYYPLLWRPADGSAAESNELQITVRAATPVEAELLDAYWSDESVFRVGGDDGPYSRVDVSRIRSVLAKYPDEPLSDHLQFVLARGLFTASETDAEVVALLEQLRVKGFRPFEVHTVLGAAYSARGDTERALDLLYDFILEKPQLLNNLNMMGRVIHVATGGSVEKQAEWLEDCSEGRRNRFAGIKIRDDVIRARQEE